MARGLYIMSSYKKYSFFKITSKLYEKYRSEYIENQRQLMIDKFNQGWLSPFSNTIIHQKTIINRTKNGTNIFSTNNPMHNQQYIKKKIEKCSGKNHYLVKKYNWYFKYKNDIEWKKIPIKTSLEQYCIDMDLSSALVYKLVNTGKYSSKGKFEGIMFKREINEN
jgi:hypothetical protein